MNVLFDLYDGWKVSARIEFTAVRTDDGSDPPGTFSTGLVDTQFQAALSTELDAQQGFGFGLRFYAPTATDDHFDNGRWRIAPAAGYRYSLSELSKESYFQIGARCPPLWRAHK